jgi:predicted RNA-binding Zn-ribbon protein involved in translation (DUF1610 family)
MGWKYTEEMLRDAVAVSRSVAGVLRHLGIVQSGGMHAHISRSIRKYGIDTSHFTGQGWRRDREFPDPRPPQEVLRLLPPGSPRANGQRLRKALLRLGRPYVCEQCGNDGTWQAGKLVLHVDHMDGNYLDCRPENLRFLCPNCHSQTASHAGKNRCRKESVSPGVHSGMSGAP